jgi:uncharacterized membrane protein YphA (DoxX/SURF4 family)
MNDVITYIKKAQTYAKAIVAGVGSVLTALVGVSTDIGVTLVPADAQAAVMFVLAALTAFSTWAVPNFNPDGQ